MTQFVIILQDGSLYKNVFVKIGRFFAQNNSDIYWYLKENESIEIFTSKNNKYLTKGGVFYYGKNHKFHHQSPVRWYIPSR